MNTKRARTFLFWFFTGAGIGLLFLYGCQEADKIISDVNSVASTGQAVLESPAGQLVPPDVRLWAALGLSLVTSGAAAYKQWRLAQMSKTTKAIVRGVEAAEQQPVPKASGNSGYGVKTAIAAEMRKLGVYDVGNKLVDRLKIG